METFIIVSVLMAVIVVGVFVRKNKHGRFFSECDH